jgi:NAD-dependent DNA ligase
MGYDACDGLQALEAAHPKLVTPDSPSQRVGGASRTPAWRTSTTARRC